jgi:hypothetical protein
MRRRNMRHLSIASLAVVLVLYFTPFQQARTVSGSLFVIPGLVPGIHVDGRDKPGDDGKEARFAPIGSLL